ncbi:FHF complex subunit HOOK interacting protein 2A-like isoform X2 [Amphiura filiformis]|uniref:FHF complex subunit HOOK interacting protein 2A-like isoform X2 n=1 Tax=Amphiura filiformis TaxID=82378 RepID=UPI003B223DE3
MFNRFAAALHHAVEALAPQQTLLEDFNFHWKSITHYFINNKDDKKPVQESNIPSHLENMLALLTQEENQMEDNQTGPCMEHLLQHKILETLHTLGKADCPPGMKQVVLIFFTNLIGKIKQPLLPHINVYKPVHGLLKVCGNVRAAPTEREEMQFLLLVCAKLRQDPYLVNFFLELPKPTLKSKEPVSLSSSSSGNQPEFSLVDSLLNLAQSPDTRIAVKACEGLMLVASLPEKLAAQCITEYTQFCTLLAERLCTLYNALPLSMDPVDVDSVEAKWGLDVYSDAEDQNMFPGKRQLISLLSWFDYCDQIAQNAHPIVAKALAMSMKERFLVPIIEPLILQTSEVGILTSTAHLVKFLQMTTSIDLLEVFVYFILGRGTEQEVPGMTDHKLRQRLIARCDHLSDEIIIMSLKLFETLLKKPHEHIINNLVLRNLQTRVYIDRTALPPPPADNEGARTDDNNVDDIGVNDENEVHTNQVNENQTVDIQQVENETVDDDHIENQADYSSLVENQADNSSHVENQADDNVHVENQADDNVENQEDDSSHVENQADDSSHVDNNTGDYPHVDNEDVHTHIVGNHGDEKQENEASNPTEQVIDRTEPFSNALLENIFTNGPDTLASEILETHENPEPSSPLFDLSPIHMPVSLLPTTVGSPTHSDISATPSASSVDSSDDGIGIHKVVNCFLTLMPEASKSSYLTGDVGYDMYLREAHRQFRECSVNCLPWEWPTYPTPLDKCPTDESFYEGTLVKMLYDKLTRMLDQTYEVNLQVTSVLSKITLFPHPLIHEYFLNPFLPVTPGCRTLNTVLQKVMIDLTMRMKAIPEFQSQVIQVRKQLMGMADERDDSLPHIDLLEGVIVLEEFCKELAAVAFVKFHAASGQTPH